MISTPQLLAIRIDKSLHFANAQHLEGYIYNREVGDCPIKHLVLMCYAVNEIDMSTLETLQAINTQLEGLGAIH